MKTETQRHTHLLKGLQPEPLASYLSALGLLRLVSEQKDPSAAGYWENNHFVLETALDRDALVAFFLDEYSPTPLVSPWNGGSGFFGGKSKKMDLIRHSQDPRFRPFRNAISVAESSLRTLGLDEKPDPIEEKPALLKLLRSRLDDEGLKWLDCCVVLTSGPKGIQPSMAPLLGSGGNDGNLEFSLTFMQRLYEMLLDPKVKTDQKKGLLSAVVFDDNISGLIPVSIGQFAPGASGGLNSSVGFEGNPQLNPWLFILALEGAIVLSSSSARRYSGASYSGGSFPFTVNHLPVGAGKLAPEEKARHEIWLPLWERPTRLPELQHLFAEGRAQNGRQQAKNPIEFSLALASHGTSRGLSGFSRFGFLQRNGKSFFATPLGYHPVGERDGTGLIRDLERWFGSYRHTLKGGSHAAQTAVRRYDSAVLNYLKTGRAQGITTIFECLGDIHQYLCTAPKAREMTRPLPEIKPGWVPLIDDGTPEFRLALSLSTLGQGQWEEEVNIRAQLGPYDARRRSWSANAENFRARWVGRDLCERMTNLLKHRLHAVEKLGRRDADRGRVGARAPLWGSATATLKDIERFIEGDIDEPRLERLLFGLSLVRPDRYAAERSYEPTFISLAFAVSKLALHQGEAQRADEIETLGPGERDVKERQRDRRHPPTTIPAQLAAGHVQSALRTSRRFLLGRRLNVPPDYLEHDPHLTSAQARRMAAALLFPISDWTYRRLARQVLHITDEPKIKPQERDTTHV